MKRGKVAERSNAPVSKTGTPVKGVGGSNPPLSAKSYPPWICAPCGARHARAIWKRSHESRLQQMRRPMTWHQPDRGEASDVCGWCGSNIVPLTDPRNYGHPAPKKTARRSVK